MNSIVQVPHSSYASANYASHLFTLARPLRSSNTWAFGVLQINCRLPFTCRLWTATSKSAIGFQIYLETGVCN